MNLIEVFALLTFILSLLSLIVDVIRLTVQVMGKVYQKKNDDSKKRLTATASPSQRSILFDLRIES